MLKIGINTNNQSGKDDIEILQNIKAAGFKNIMMSFKSKNIEDTIIKAKELGLNIEYFHLNNNAANDLWVEGESNKRYVKQVVSQIELCGKYNISIAVMHATVGSPTDNAYKPNEHALNCMKEILKVAKKHNVKIALENIDGYSTKHLFYLLDNIKDSNLGFCYDVGHHHLYNPNTNLVKKYGDRLFAVHLHDNLMDWYPGYDYTRDLHMLPFDGKINFEKVCKNLKQQNYNGILMLEVHKITCGEPQKYEAIDNINYLKEAYSRAFKLSQMLE